MFVDELILGKLLTSPCTLVSLFIKLGYYYQLHSVALKLS